MLHCPCTLKCPFVLSDPPNIAKSLIFKGFRGANYHFNASEAPILHPVKSFYVPFLHPVKSFVIACPSASGSSGSRCLFLCVPFPFLSAIYTRSRAKVKQKFKLFSHSGKVYKINYIVVYFPVLSCIIFPTAPTGCRSVCRRSFLPVVPLLLQ